MTDKTICEKCGEWVDLNGNHCCDDRLRIEAMSVEQERRNRIRAAAAAYAYEVDNEPIMSDAEFDALCLKIRPEVDTGNDKLDEFFRTEFDPSTGSWVHRHPDKAGLRRVVAVFRKVD